MGGRGAQLFPESSASTLWSIFLMNYSEKLLMCRVNVPLSSSFGKVIYTPAPHIHSVQHRLHDGSTSSLMSYFNSYSVIGLFLLTLLFE